MAADGVRLTLAQKRWRGCYCRRYGCNHPFAFSAACVEVYLTQFPASTNILSVLPPDASADLVDFAASVDARYREFMTARQDALQMQEN